MASFYRAVLGRAVRDKAFRQHLVAEVWEIIKDSPLGLPFTPRRDYVYCRYVSPPVGRGKFVAPQMLTTRVGAYGLLFDEQERLLMVRDKTMNFHWNLPGGGMRRSETLQTALKREFLEETGIEVEVGTIVDAWDDFQIMPYGVPTHSLLHFFLVRKVSGTLQPEGNGFDTTEVEFRDMSAEIRNADDPTANEYRQRMRRLARRGLELHRSNLM